MTNSNSAGVYLYYSIIDVPVYSFGWLAFATLLACHLSMVFNNSNKNGWILTTVSTVHNNEKGAKHCKNVFGSTVHSVVIYANSSFETRMNFLLL